MTSKYYTGTGDKGTTGLLASSRVSKGDVLIEAIGNVDELNSYIGIAAFHIHNDEIRAMLKHVQNELFIIGANLATIDEKKISQAVLDDKAIIRLEEHIQKLGSVIPPLKQFVLPGGCDGAVHLQFARALARRAERRIVNAQEKYKVDPKVIAYINRLSSFLFVAALFLNYSEGIEEDHPTY